MKNVKEIWFGNFYEPAYSDFSYTDRTIELVKKLGFTSVLLDSKAWEDFEERFEKGVRSQYVEAQEHMMEAIRENGLEYSFLALYLCGDNLYPDIRTSPPILGSSVTDRNGEDKRWYRYWAEDARASMEKHVRGLMSTYPDASRRICSMWDPIVSPSFDADGEREYISFLNGKYKSIDNLNRAYSSSYGSFDDLSISDLWIDIPSDDNLTLLADNREWQSRELASYFSDIKRRIGDYELVPMMAQWGFFLTFDGSRLPGVGLADLWDTANRGIDLFLLKDTVSSINFISVPIDPDGRADCYVASYHHRFMASLNRGRDFLGGIFLGRFLYGDVYSEISAEEIIGTIAASGASGYRAYGINGLDDGGMLDRMPSFFLDNLRKANGIFDEAVEKLGKKLPNDIAIIFPSAMALSEPYGIEGNEERRLDSLGYLRLVLDSGLDADVVDIRDDLSGYKTIILPSDSLYDGRFDDIITAFIEDGGTVIASASHPYHESLGIMLEKEERKVVKMADDAMLIGPSFSVNGGKTVLSYKDGNAAASEIRCGNGRLIQLGFDYGYEYVSKHIPHVPRAEKNSAIYPVSLQRRQFITELIGGDMNLKGLEISCFENGRIVINHTSYEREYDGRKLAPRSFSVFTKDRA